MRAVTCKRLLPKVEGEAFSGAELIDLTKIQRPAAFEVEQAPRDFYFANWQATIRRPVCAVKDKRTLTFGGGKNLGIQVLALAKLKNYVGTFQFLNTTRGLS